MGDTNEEHWCWNLKLWQVLQSAWFISKYIFFNPLTSTSSSAAQLGSSVGFEFVSIQDKGNKALAWSLLEIKREQIFLQRLGVHIKHDQNFKAYFEPEMMQSYSDRVQQ